MTSKSAQLLSSLMGARSKRAAPAATSAATNAAASALAAAVGAAGATADAETKGPRTRTRSRVSATAQPTEAEEPKAEPKRRRTAAKAGAADDLPSPSDVDEKSAKKATPVVSSSKKAKTTAAATASSGPPPLFPVSPLRVSRPSPPPHAPPRLGPGYYVGVHVSAAGGVDKAPANAAAIGCRAFALDLRNKRRWDSPPLADATAKAFQAEMKRLNFPLHAVVPHGSYLMNLASPDDAVVEKSKAALLEEMQRCARLGIVLYNFHPGSTVGQGSIEDGVAKVAEGINWVHQQTKGDQTICVLENTAGGGSSLGTTFEELAAIITLVTDRSRVGVCLDTCHLFASGHDLSPPGGLARVLKRFDEVVGMGYLRALHVNDSKAELGSRRDRHEHIGHGCIGLEAFKELMSLPELEGLPLVLETPVELRGDKEEVAHLVGLARADKGDEKNGGEGKRVETVDVVE